MSIKLNLAKKRSKQAKQKLYSLFRSNNAAKYVCGMTTIAQIYLLVEVEWKEMNEETDKQISQETITLLLTSWGPPVSMTWTES